MGQQTESQTAVGARFWAGLALYWRWGVNSRETLPPDATRILLESHADGGRPAAWGEESRARKELELKICGANSQDGEDGAWYGQDPRKHSDRTRLHPETAREAQSPEAARRFLRLIGSQG
jgi:hypothetical protein